MKITLVKDLSKTTWSLLLTEPASQFNWGPTGYGDIAPLYDGAIIQTFNLVEAKSRLEAAGYFVEIDSEI